MFWGWGKETRKEGPHKMLYSILKHSLLFHKDNLQLWQKQKKKKFSEAFFKKLILYCILNMAGTVGFDFEYVKVK